MSDVVLRSAGPAASRPLPWYRQLRWQMAALAVAVLVAMQVLLGGSTGFPERWDLEVHRPVNDFQSWVRRNRDTNVVLAHVLRPIGDNLQSLYDHLLDVLLGLPWFWLPLAFFLVIARSGRWVSAVGAAGGLLYIEVAGLHDEGMATIALMLICVGLCIVVGAPLGIWAGLNDRVYRVLRPMLDALQSLPSTVYLVPAVLFFGIRQVPAVIATVAFGIAPMVRITSLGIRQVPVASVEAGRIFGSSRWQLLWKVQVPQATKSFVVAVNQTIMMCLGMVVIAALVGAGGLGGELIDTLKLRSPGRGFLVGLAITAVAIAFDRFSRSFIDRSHALPVPPRVWWGATAGVLVLALLVGRVIDVGEVPWVFDSSIANPIDDAIRSIRDNFGDALQTINDFVVRDVVVRLRDFLGTTLAWSVLVSAMAALAWVLRGWRLALFAVVGLTMVGLLGMWSAWIETFAQVLVAVLVSMVIALPIGIFVGRRRRIETVLEPFLDALQTIPSFVYAIPFVMLFQVGYVPGILATVLYAVPPGIRLTALAMQRVDAEPLEAATTFGATDRQRLWGVHLPLAMRGLVLAANQVTMMAISMVIIAGMIGGQGLGYQAVAALTKPDTGLGVEAGLSMLVMAILLDRLSEGLADRLDPASVQGAARK